MEFGLQYFFWNQYVCPKHCCWPKHCLCCSLWEKSCATRPGKVVVLSFPYKPFCNPFIFTVRIRCSPLFVTLPRTMSIELFDSETAWKVACRCHDQVEHRIEARWGTKTWTVFSWGLPLPYKSYDSQQLLSLPGSAGFMKQLVQLTFINFTSKCAKFKLFCLGSACHVCFRHPWCLSLAGIMFIFRFTPSSTPSSHDPTITNIFLLGIVVGVVFVIIEIIQGLIVVIAICISNDDYLFKLLFVIIFLLLSSISFS